MNSQDPHPKLGGLLGLPVEIMGLIMNEIELLPEPYKQLLQFAKACRALAAQAIPQLYYKDVVESLKLTQDLNMPIALQWACWYGVLGAAKSSLEALARTDTNVTHKISQPFNNDNLYHLRYKTVKRRGPSGPAYGYLHWGSKSGLLHLACLRGNTAIAKLLLEKGAHPDTADGKKLPALAYALNKDVAKLLIDHGADINITHGGTDENALCHLISWGPMEDVDWNKEFNMPRGDGALSPLHTRRDHLSTIKFLINNPKTDIYADRIRDISPLQLAVTRRYSEVVELLLNKGASPNPIDSEAGGKRLLLTDALKRTENSPIIKMLLDAGAEADLDQMPEGGLSEEQGSSLPIMNLTSSGSNPLYAREEVDIARLVCRKIKTEHFNANIDGHPALWHYVRKGRGDIGQVLIQAGADPEVANVEVRDTVLGLIAH